MGRKRQRRTKFTRNCATQPVEETAMSDTSGQGIKVYPGPTAALRLPHPGTRWPRSRTLCASAALQFYPSL